jgi:hypothetical protein
LPYEFRFEVGGGGEEQREKDKEVPDGAHRWHRLVSLSLQDEFAGPAL